MTGRSQVGGDAAASPRTKPTDTEVVMIKRGPA